MKLLITTIAAVLVVGCGESQSPEPPTAKAPDISIHEAAAKGNIEAVKQHLAAGEDVNANSWGGLTPLHDAANEGHKEVAELLITKGADVNAKDKIGGTPLHLSAHSGQREIVELLIANGANMNAKIEVGKWKDQTSLSLAIQNNQTETADLLRKHGGKTGEELNVIIAAAKKGNIEAVKQHLAAGVDVNAKNKYGSTPLHNAAFEGHKEIAELLINKGANVNVKLESGLFKGHTPLNIAIEFKRTETADLLRKHGGKTGEELKAEGK